MRSPSKGAPSARQWQLRRVKTRVWVEVDKKHDGWASRTAVGICCVIVAKWTFHLVDQAVYSWSLLAQLDQASRRRTFMDFFRKPVPAPSPVSGNGQVAMPADLKERAPTLGNWLCSPVWPDGELRQPSSLIVFMEGGMFKAGLNDKDNNMILWASCKSFNDLLEALEARLTDDQVDWRKSRSKGKRS